MYFIFLLISASSTGITPSQTNVAVSATGTISLTFTVSTTAGSSDCTLSSYNGQFQYPGATAGVTYRETYVTSTYYERLRFTGTDSEISSISFIYQPKQYYVLSVDSLVQSSTTDYVEMVCEDTSSNIYNSTTIIGIAGGWTPFCTPTTCSNGGNCNPLDGSCQCYYPYYGTTCQNKDCGLCHNSGTCTTSGSCTCQTYAHGTNCQYLYCPYQSTSTNCNHGYCDMYSGTCICYAGYEGAACNVPKCLNNCNQGGVCSSSTGLCTCYTNYFGHDCAYQSCPRSCGMDGGCNFVTGECNCYGSFAVNDCMFSTCASTSNGICNGTGYCNSYTGLCVCNSGYAGIDCSLAQ